MTTPDDNGFDRATNKASTLMLSSADACWTRKKIINDAGILLPSTSNGMEASVVYPYDAMRRASQ